MLSSMITLCYQFQNPYDMLTSKIKVLKRIILSQISHQHHVVCKDNYLYVLKILIVSSYNLQDFSNFLKRYCLPSVVLPYNSLKISSSHCLQFFGHCMGSFQPSIVSWVANDLQRQFRSRKPTTVADSKCQPYITHKLMA